jgi:hypothetical protein
MKEDDHEKILEKARLIINAVINKEVDSEKIRENVEYVKARTKQIEDRIVAATEDLFESPKDREDLHITIRTAYDFHKFLLDFGETPPQDEAEYVMYTIRAGFDWAFQLAWICHSISDEYTKWSFDLQVISNFRDLRVACLRRFEEMCQPSATAGEMLASLMAIVHLEFMFVAQTFPSIVDSNY